MLYRVETGLHAGLDDTQGRKTAQHLRKALDLSTGAVRQVKVFTAEGFSGSQKIFISIAVLSVRVWITTLLLRSENYNCPSQPQT